MKKGLKENRILINVAFASIILNSIGLYLAKDFDKNGELFVIIYIFLPIAGILFGLAVLPIVKRWQPLFFFLIVVCSFSAQYGGALTFRIWEKGQPFGLIALLLIGGLAATLTLFIIRLFNKEFNFTLINYSSGFVFGFLSNLPFCLTLLNSEVKFEWLVFGTFIWQMSVAAIINGKNKRQVTNPLRQAGSNEIGVSLHSAS